MITVLVVCFVIACLALVTAVLAHLHHESYRAQVDAELQILNDSFEHEVVRLDAKIDGGTIPPKQS